MDTHQKDGGYSADLIMRFEEIYNPITIHSLESDKALLHSGQTAELVVIVDGEEERKRVEITEIFYKDIDGK